MTVLLVLAGWLVLSVVVALACAAFMRAGKGPQQVPDVRATEGFAAGSPRPDDVRPAAA